jgi:hypothetical protein
MSLRLGLDCYNFAGTILSLNADDLSSEYIPPEERLQYHTYWCTDLAPFAERQEWMLKSFFATQNMNASRLVLWSNDDLSGNEVLQKYLRRYPDSFILRIANFDSLSRDTELEGSPLLDLNDKKAWMDGDLLRLLVLWSYSDIWVDMDSLLARDLRPLVEHEFVTQWDCYGKPTLPTHVRLTSSALPDKSYMPFNGALMHFRQHSPYLCEAFHIMSISPLPRVGSTNWGATLYPKLWRRLVAASIPPFSVLPFCFSDGRSCRLDSRMPDPFQPDPRDGMWTEGMGREEGGGLDHVLGKVFGVHLHNQWQKSFPEGGWVQRLLLDRYERKLEGRQS